MKLSSRTRYGMRAILELALEYGKAPLQIKVIAYSHLSLLQCVSAGDAHVRLT